MRRDAGSAGVSLVPSSVTSPALGLMSPARILSSVVFPAPFGPTMASVSPGASVRSSPRSTTRGPKARRMPCAWRRGDGMGRECSGSRGGSGRG